MKNVSWKNTKFTVKKWRLLIKMKKKKKNINKVVYYSKTGLLSVYLEGGKKSFLRIFINNKLKISVSEANKN